MSETVEAARARYLAAAHAMQSGVAAKMHHDPSETTGKHLRVGVNSAMSDHAALVQLLVRKGVIGEAEYFTALADQMEAEKAMYEAWLTERLGGLTKITLG